jgi:hypothetical protein
MDPQKYNRYMKFEDLKIDPWREEFLSEQLRNIGAANFSASDRDVDSIRFCYDQAPSRRSYHVSAHGAFVGQPDAPEALLRALSDEMPEQKAKAILSIAGLFHDVAYKHVDALDDEGTRAWPKVLEESIGDFVEYKRTLDEKGQVVFRTRLKPKGKDDPLTQMVAHIFGGIDEQGISHKEGGNEFDSALAAAKFLEGKEAPAKSIIAVVAAIAATVPFKPARDKDGDGYMGDLAKRVKATKFRDCELSWEDTNDIMRLSVHLANRDISPFILKDNFAEVVNGGRRIKQEEVRTLREGVLHIQGLVEAARRESSAPRLYEALGGGSDTPIVSSENVPHIYIPRNPDGTLKGAEHAYPPIDVYLEAVANTQKNAAFASDFFKAHETGVTLIASIATLLEESEALVPGIVDSKHWHARAIPPEDKIARLDDEEKRVYEELMLGISQRDVGVAFTQRSPTGGLIAGAAGKRGVDELSSEINAIRREAHTTNPFANEEFATRYINKVKEVIGPESLLTVLTEMQRVATFYQDDPLRGKPGRAERLKELSRSLGLGEIREYTSHPTGVGIRGHATSLEGHGPGRHA